MSTDQPYTPTEQTVRASYRLYMQNGGIRKPDAEFDRFIAQVKRDAWREGMLAGDVAAYHGTGAPPNPYKETP